MPIAQKMQAVFGTVQNFLAYNATYEKWAGDPDAANFAFGNPHEMPLAQFVDTLKQAITPQNKDWFAYKMSEPAARHTIAQSLQKSHGIDFKASDISLTNGAFAALTIALRAVIDPGDEVIFITPPWFFYEALIVDAGAVPVRVQVNPETFDLDLAAIEGAITPKTRAIIVNSPNNPTGKIYPAETLEQLAQLLTSASERYGKPIYLLSDEAYRRIVFDDRQYISPAKFYPNTFVLYTYGKTLLTPGQRLGYVALPPDMPDREMIRNGLLLAQIVTGFAFPNALLQHSLPELEKLSIDIPHLQHKRDWMVKALREMGYTVHAPEGTFYLLPRSPIEDDMAFCEMLAAYKILCLPGKVVEMPGYFRISLTANDEMIERALPGFAAVLEKSTV